MALLGPLSPHKRDAKYRASCRGGVAAFGPLSERAALGEHRLSSEGGPEPLRPKAEMDPDLRHVKELVGVDQAPEQIRNGSAQIRSICQVGHRFLQFALRR